MNEKVKIGIIICARYRTCTGGKCLRSLREKQGAFAVYEGRELELVGFATCGGCPGGNIESAPEEMKKNGAEVIHLATGFLVGYPPCPLSGVLSEGNPGEVRFKGSGGYTPDSSKILYGSPEAEFMDWPSVGRNLEALSS